MYKHTRVLVMSVCVVVSVRMTALGTWSLPLWDPGSPGLPSLRRSQTGSR